LQLSFKSWIVRTLLYLTVCTSLHTAPKTPTPVFNANPITVSKSFFRFGDQLITLEKYGSEEARSYVLVSLHGNELSSFNTALAFAGAQHAPLYRLKHKDTRLVVADLHDHTVQFDPAQIFTTWGRRVHLKKNNSLNRYAIEQVELLSHFLLNEMPLNKTIVSLNNSEGRYSINDFVKGKLEKEAKDVYVAAGMDPFDYFSTADEAIFEKLKAKDLNVVLLQKGKVKDNGSLSVYCLRSNSTFVNIETKAEHTGEEVRMLEALDAVLK
jgi:hypothetical protein